MVIGTQLTGNKLEKTIKKMMKDSKTLQKVAVILEKLDVILGNEDLSKEVVGFFKAAKELVESPEAKNFFKNVSKALKEFTEADSDSGVKLPAKRSNKEVN